MSKKSTIKKSLVLRITVDEKLSDDLIRLLISPIAKGIKEFYDNKNDWGEEEEYYVQPETYVKIMNIPIKEARELSWTDLQEGQVFLSGQFKTVSSKKSPVNFTINPGQERFLRIDQFIKKDIQALYFKALRGKGV